MARPTHDEVLKQFMDELLAAEQAWQPHLRKFRHNYDVYLNSDKKKREEETKGRLFVHHAYQQIETIVPRMVAPDPRFELDPRDGQSHDQVIALQRKIDYDLEVDRFVEKQVDLAKTALISGVTVAKVIWDKRTTKVKQHNYNADPMDILRGVEPAVIETTRVDRNGPSMIPVNLSDFFPEPGPTSISSMNHVFHRVWLTEDELMARKELTDSNGKPVFKNILKALRTPRGSDNSQHLPNESSEDIEGRRGNRYEVIERWKKNRLTVVVNRSIVIRDQENPYWHGEIPFVDACSQPDIRSFVGISEVEVIENIVKMIHKFENLRIRAAEFAINPVLKINSGLRGGQNFEWRPGAHLFLDRPDQVQPETAPANLAAAWDEVQAYLGYMQQVSGVSPFIAGADPGAAGVNQETATGASILQAEANKRLALKLMQMQNMYSKVAKFFVQLNQQYMVKNELVRISGPEGNNWVEITPQDIAGNYDVRASNSTESLSRNAEVQRLTDAVNTLMPMQGIQMADGTVVDLKYPLRSLLQSIGVDADKCFAQAPPPQPMMENPNG